MSAWIGRERHSPDSYSLPRMTFPINQEWEIAIVGVIGAVIGGVVVFVSVLLVGPQVSLPIFP